MELLIAMPAETEVFGHFDPPVLVVTAASGEEHSGCLVGFATQCSILPPRLLVCLSVVNHTARVAAMASSLGVHVLGSGQRVIASIFGEETGDATDKLAQVQWHVGSTGAPLLSECAAWCEGIVLERVPLGDHVGYLLAISDGAQGSAPGTLRQSDVSSFAAGHPPEEVLGSG